MNVVEKNKESELRLKIVMNRKIPICVHLIVFHVDEHKTLKRNIKERDVEWLIGKDAIHFGVLSSVELDNASVVSNVA